MPGVKKLNIKESNASLKDRYYKEKKSKIKSSKLRMLILMVENGIHAKRKLANRVNVSPTTIQLWKEKYRNGGINGLLLDDSLKKKMLTKTFTNAVKEKAIYYLNRSKEVYSVTKICYLLSKEFRKDIKYDNFMKYVKKYLLTNYQNYKERKKGI